MKRYTRREFLGHLTFATVAAASGITRVARGVAPKRVIIVGAGLAGLCAAYELDASGHEVTALEAQTRPGGRVQTLRDPFDDGLFAEAGASRIPTSHDLTLGYARIFGLPLVPFEPVNVPSIRYAYRQRSRIGSRPPLRVAIRYPGGPEAADSCRRAAAIHRSLRRPDHRPLLGRMDAAVTQAIRPGHTR